MSDQCAISSDGSLKDAADIQWNNDADDAAPISSASHSLASTSAWHKYIGKYICYLRFSVRTWSLTGPNQLNRFSEVRSKVQEIDRTGPVVRFQVQEICLPNLTKPDRGITTWAWAANAETCLGRNPVISIKLMLWNNRQWPLELRP